MPNPITADTAPNAAGTSTTVPPFDRAKVFGGYEKDARAFDELARVIRGGRSLALVGAGISARAQLPSWPVLLKALEDRVIEESISRVKAPDQRTRMGNEAALPKELQDDIAWHGEMLRTRLEKLSADAYLDTLVRTFGVEPTPEASATLLARMPFRHVLTTNYDRVMLAAMTAEHSAPPKVIDWTVDQDALCMMHTFLDADAPPHLVHLHGHIGRPEGIVLTDRDYARHYLRSDATMRKLFAIFALNRVVFFGFSLNDADLMTLLRQVAGALTYEQNTRHFVVLGAKKGYPRDDVRERLVQKFGVAPVFYDSSDGHAQFEPLMRELVRRVEQDGDGSTSTPDITDVFGGAVTAEAMGAAPAEPPTPLSNVPPPVFAPYHTPSQSAPAMPTSAAAGFFRFKRNPPPEAPTVQPPVRVSRSNRDHPDDPRKGMFGGKAEANGFRLAAKVVQSDEGADWFEILLWADSIDPSRPLSREVTFYLHDTFTAPIRKVAAKNGRAELELSAYGAFTVGAVVGEGGTELELDLASLEDAPKRFREL